MVQQFVGKGLPVISCQPAVVRPSKSRRQPWRRSASVRRLGSAAKAARAIRRRAAILAAGGSMGQTIIQALWSAVKQNDPRGGRPFRTRDDFPLKVGA